MYQAAMTLFGAQRDEQFMHEALQLARKGADHNEVPVGALVVNVQGIVIGRGYNQVETAQSQCAHAEVTAIRQATQKLNNWRLDGCWLYVTLEPCVMCMGLLALSRVHGIVYAAPSPLFGCRLDNVISSRVYKYDTLVVVAGVCAEQAGVLLKQFFQAKRK